MTEFQDQVVLVTGAGRGIGREIAAAFAARGARVAVNDLTPVNLDPTIAALREEGGQVKGYLADIAKKIPVQTMITQIVEDWGLIDILVNNAGVEPHASILDMDEWDWQRTLTVNLTGPFLTTQVAGRVMRDQGGGVIINISASQGAALVDRAAFIASKTGLLGLTRAAAVELAPYNIRVNAVCPGMEAPEDAIHQPPENLLAAVGTPGELSAVVGMVLYLASPAAAQLTGQIIDAAHRPVPTE
jgi:NAD(P)-dependent dehydrogenase (short-subunit alcohol dehydrogenase family)